MKKIVIPFITFLLFVGFVSCTGPQGPQGTNGQDGLLSQVYEISNVNFVASGFSVLYNFSTPIYASDHVLIYRLAGTTTLGADIWKPLPETYFFPDGTLDFSYNFNFSKNDFQIYLDGNNLQTVTDAYRLGQVFRIVVVPGVFVNKMNSTTPTSYNELIKKYNIDESKIIQLK